MGENVLRSQVKNFEKGRDRSLRKMTAPSLFVREDKVLTHYTAAPVNGNRVQVGDKLVGHVSADGNCVTVADGHRSVGMITGDGAKTIIRDVRASDGIGFAQLEVTDTKQISGFFTVAVEKTKEDE